MNNENPLMERVLTAVNNYLESTKAYGDSDYHETGIHASVAGLCRRALLYQFYNFNKKDLIFQKRLMFWRGHQYHGLILNSLQNDNSMEVLMHDFDLSDYLPENFKGSCDIVYRDKELSKTVLLEVKTAMPNLFNLYSDFLPLEHHVIQAQIYEYALSKLAKETGEYVDECWIQYYDSAGTNRPLYFQVQPDHSKVLSVIKDIQSLIDIYNTNKELPEILDLDFKSDKYNNLQAKVNWNCSYCDFRDITCKSYTHELDKYKTVGKLEEDKIIISKNWFSMSETLLTQLERKTK